MKIGLEVHVQLPTRSKMFCSCPTTGATEPNQNVCPTCLGMPGSKPSLNKAAVEMGLTIAKLLNCSIPEKTWFSRKTYFYPDLCKHFQITQYDRPIGERGMYHLGKKPIRITRVHLEEDPGKTKRVGDETSLIDYNRSGIPLVEIVTEPDLSSPAEAREFLKALLRDIRHVVEIPEDGERSIRVDCNLSVGIERCEVKNVTGLKNVENALTYEAVRQTKVLKAGGKILRETRRFDEDRKVTVPARKKEFEEDYGYIGEPDLGTYSVKILADNLKIKESPLNLALRLSSELDIDEKLSKQIVNTSVELAKLFEYLSSKIDPKTVLPWITGPISSNWKFLENDVNEKRDDILSILNEFKDNKINDMECSIRLKSLITGENTEIIRSSAGDLNDIIIRCIGDNPSTVEDYKKNEKAANRIIGAVMKETGGSYSSSDIVTATKAILDSML